MIKRGNIYVNLCDTHDIACQPYSFLVYPDKPGPLDVQLYRPDEFRLISDFCMSDMMKAPIKRKVKKDKD